MSKRGIALVVLAAVAIGLLIYSQYKPSPFRVSGFVEAYEIRTGSRVGGRVQKVFIDEGARIKKGELLVALEPFDLKERRRRLRAIWRQRRTNTKNL